MSRQLIVKFGVIAIVVVFFLIVAAGCDTGARGFALPPGDVEAGKAAFVTLGCNRCHSVGQEISRQDHDETEINVALGGVTSRIKTYGELVTSIIHPSHRISSYHRSNENVDAEGQSRMQRYNEVMTVQQLVDITSFLETTYEVVRPQYAPMYGP